MSVVDSQSFHLSRLFLRCGSGVEIGVIFSCHHRDGRPWRVVFQFRKIFWMMKRLKLQTKTVVITNETSCKCFLLCSNLCILTHYFSISRFVYVTCGLCGKSLRSMLRLDIPPVFLTRCHLILSFWFHGDLSCIFPYLHGITRLFSQKLQVSLRESSESSENCSHKKFH